MVLRAVQVSTMFSRMRCASAEQPGSKVFAMEHEELDLQAVPGNERMTTKRPGLDEMKAFERMYAELAMSIWRSSMRSACPIT